MKVYLSFKKHRELIVFYILISIYHQVTTTGHKYNLEKEKAENNALYKHYSLSTYNSKILTEPYENAQVGTRKFEFNNPGTHRCL
jgi:hypothetical protein